MCLAIREVCTTDRLRITNFIAYGLLILGIVLRFILSESDQEGVGDTPTFLFICQLVLTTIFVLLLICGEIHKPAAILYCFPLLMSKVGRGSIIIMISLPVTNFLDVVTAIIAILCAIVGALNIVVGFNDGPIDLKYADGGIPAAANAGPASKPAHDPTGGFPPRQVNYEMQPRGPPTSQGGPPPGPPAQQNFGAPPQPPMGPPPGANQPPPGQQRQVVMNDPFMDVKL